MLRRIPGLACEVYATWDAPNPTARPQTRGSRAFIPAPTRIAVYDALRLDDRGLVQLLREACKAVALFLHNGASAAFYVWEDTCRFLLAERRLWDGLPLGRNLVEPNVELVYGELAWLAKVSPPLTLKCTRWGCGALVHPLGINHATQRYEEIDSWDGVQMCRCESGHEISLWPEIEKLGRQATFTICEVAEATGIPLGTLKSWKRAGKLVPFTVEDGICRYVLEGLPR